MKLDKNIIKELQEIAPTLAKLDKVNFYQVAEGYFENSRTNILESLTKEHELSEELSPTLALLKKKQLYTAPQASFFESFSDRLINEVHAEDVEEELSYALPALQHLQKKELYNVPADYFASFPESMTHLAVYEVREHPATVEQISNRWSELTERLLGLIARPRYAFVMASVLSLIVCIGLVINAETLSNEDKIFAQMQQLSDADLHHYFGKHRDDFDERTILHNINNVDFTHYFDKPDQVIPQLKDQSKSAADEETITEDNID